MVTIFIYVSACLNACDVGHDKSTMMNIMVDVDVSVDMIAIQNNKEGLGGDVNVVSGKCLLSFNVTISDFSYECFLSTSNNFFSYIVALK